jgi:UDPglucose 6-dehydrogenase
VKVTVVGTGYVGLVTGVCLSSLDHKVTCVDVLRERVDLINRGESPFFEPSLPDMLQKSLKRGNFAATTDLRQSVLNSDITIIAVGTPSDNGKIDLKHVEAASKQIGEALRGGKTYHVVVVKSTVIPGTTENVVRPILEAAAGRKVGEFGLCMNPEFLREGSAVKDFLHSDRVIIGQWDQRSGDVVESLYHVLSCPILRMRLCNAELTKYTSNCLLATLVSFGNEMAGIFEAIPGADIETVMKGLFLDRRMSSASEGHRHYPEILSYLRAGTGFGGSCLPKDVNAVRAMADEMRIETPLLDGVMQVNSLRPERVVLLLERELGSLREANVLVLGLAFKPGTDDMRDSPALALVDILLRRGCNVKVYDPVAMSAAEKLLDSRVTVCSDCSYAFKDVDGVLIATAWQEFAAWDWNGLSRKMRRRIIVDARGALQNVSLPDDVVYKPVGTHGNHRGGTRAVAP